MSWYKKAQDADVFGQEGFNTLQEQLNESMNPDNGNQEVLINDIYKRHHQALSDLVTDMIEETQKPVDGSMPLPQYAQVSTQRMQDINVNLWQELSKALGFNIAV